MGFVALRRLKIDGKWRLPGEPVPEANRWKHWRAYVNTGHIAGAPDDPEAEDPPSARPDFSELTVDKLKALVARKGLEVKPTGKSGRALKRDYVAALEAS